MIDAADSRSVTPPPIEVGSDVVFPLPRIQSARWEVLRSWIQVARWWMLLIGALGTIIVLLIRRWYQRHTALRQRQLVIESLRHDLTESRGLTYIIRMTDAYRLLYPHPHFTELAQILCEAGFTVDEAAQIVALLYGDQTTLDPDQLASVEQLLRPHTAKLVAQLDNISIRSLDSL